MPEKGPAPGARHPSHLSTQAFRISSQQPSKQAGHDSEPYRDQGSGKLGNLSRSHSLKYQSWYLNSKLQCLLYLLISRVSMKGALEKKDFVWQKMIDRG